MRAATLDTRLEAIAGAPAFQAGDAAEGYIAGPLARDPFDGITLLMIYDASGTVSANYGNPMGIGNSAEGGFRIQTGPAGENHIRVRADFFGGASNVVTWASGGRTAGRHVVSARLSEGLTEMYIDMNGSPRAGGRATTALLGDGVPAQTVVANGHAGDLRRAAAFSWPRCLTDLETIMLHRWMMRRYPEISGGGGRKSQRSRARRADFGLAA